MIGDALGGLGGAIGGGIGLAVAGPGGRKYARQAVDVWRKLQSPDFDMRSLTAPELAVLAEQMPEIYQAIVPQDIQLAQDSPELRAAQMRGLANVEQVAQEGLPYVDQVAMQDIGRGLAGEQRRFQQGVLSDLGQRGRLGAGDELVARMMGGQQQAELARGFGSDLATLSANRRLTASAALPGLAGGVRGQDFSQSLANADIVNNFNAMISQMQSQAAQYNAGARERAQAYNVGTQQRIGETNPLLRYDVSLQNLGRQNLLRQQGFDNQALRAQGLSNALFGRGNLEEARRAQTIAAATQIGEGVGQGVGGAFDLNLAPKKKKK